MRGADFFLICFLLLLGVTLLVVVLPIHVRFFYKKKRNISTLLLRCGVFNERIGIEGKFPLGAGRKKIIPWRNTRKTRIKSFSKPQGVSRFRFLQELRMHLIRLEAYSFLIRSFLQKSSCKRLYWETTIGFTDYAFTGMVAGILWTGKGSICGYLSRFLKFESSDLKIQVIPNFGKPCFEIVLDCILETRFGHIIVGLVRFLLLQNKLKQRKNF